MEKPQDSLSYGYKKLAGKMPSLSKFQEHDHECSRSVEAWFLGPKGENVDEFERWILEAIRDHVYWRRNFHPEDPGHITREIKRSPEFTKAFDNLDKNYRSLLAMLKKSVPFFSMRYQGHMNWDLTIPGMLGYFAAMLYNPNNVAFEGSTATTILEILVGDDLCKMLGYKIPTEEEIEKGYIRPWGHITCDGTVANIEALWSARNLKLYPLAVQKAARELGVDEGFHVGLANGSSSSFVNLDLWTLLNLKVDDILNIPERLEKEQKISQEKLNKKVSEYSLQNLGIFEFHKHFSLNKSPLFFVPGSKHYSFPKAAALLGIGSSSMRNVPLDLDARLNIDELDKMLNECLEQKIPIYTVISVMGTTEESSVDPLQDILSLREKYRQKGLEFTVHADAAWGGYHASLVRDETIDLTCCAGESEEPLISPLSQYVTEQFLALEKTDSITIDPHKSGYIPYPAGALCYRNSAMRNLVTFSAPVVFHGNTEPTIGIYGVEGSKPGAAAASVYLSHRVIPLNKEGYGKIIGQALYSCKKLYVRLLCMAKDKDRFVVVPIPRLPTEKNNQSEQEIIKEKQLIKNQIYGLDNKSINRNVRRLLPEIGPDQNILAYAFNFKEKNGALNQNLSLMNKLNKAIYDHLSINPGEDIYNYDLVVSTTDLDIENYGKDFIEDYKRRSGIKGEGDKITVLRSVVMDPWVTETTSGSFLETLEEEFRKAANLAINDLFYQKKGAVHGW